LNGRAYEIAARVVEQKSLAARPKVSVDSRRRECASDRTPHKEYGMQRIPDRLKEAGNSDAARSPFGHGDAFFTVLIVLSIVAILVAVFFFRGRALSAVKAAGTPMPGYKPWIPKRA
jgi:hypothetical protein